MKSWPCLAALAVLVIAANATAQNRYAALRGAYASAMTVETAGSLVTGSVTVEITTSVRRSDQATLRISGTLYPANTISGTGNPVPVQASLRFRRGRVRASDFLLGLNSQTRASRAARVAGSKAAFRFTLVSRQGLGRLRCSLRVKDGALNLDGRGLYTPGGSQRDTVRTIIAPPTPTPTP